MDPPSWWSPSFCTLETVWRGHSMDNQPNTQAFFLVVGNLLRTAVFGKKYLLVCKAVSKTVFSSFLGDQVFASQIKTKEEFYRVTPTLVSGSVLSHPSLVQSQTPDQRLKTVQCPKQFFPLFLGTKSLHHRSRLRKSCIGQHWPLLVGQF